MKSSAACSDKLGRGQRIDKGDGYQRKQPRLISHAAADHDLLRHDRVDDVAQAGGEVGHL